MEFAPIHWVIVALVILVLFGGRKIPEVMRGLGTGIREFREGMRGDQPAQTNPPPAPPAATSAPTQDKK